ncbi:MAG TPA: tetratricopeptide repeat protein [Kofleriaceae bacterium]|nr:tetratricopeptide repeat protein [Kofleriaceae bacterium]
MPVPPIAALVNNLRRTLRDGDLAEASRILAHLQHEAPLGLETGALELELLVRSRRLEEADRLARRLVARFPGSAHVRYWTGRAQYARKRYADAEASFRESGKLAPHVVHDHWLAKTLTQLRRFDDAEAMLLRVVEQRPRARADLAWLYELRGDAARALAEAEAHLAMHGDDAYVQAQRDRLRARTMEHGQLAAEVEALAELGEQVSEPVLAEYIEALLRDGRGAEVRALVRARMPALSARGARSLAWSAYKLQAYDIAFELFAAAFAGCDDKQLAALEAAAKKSGRLEDLIALYEGAAAHRPSLHGRLRKLKPPGGRRG